MFWAPLLRQGSLETTKPFDVFRVELSQHGLVFALGPQIRHIVAAKKRSFFSVSQQHNNSG